MSTAEDVKASRLMRDPVAAFALLNAAAAAVGSLAACRDDLRERMLFKAADEIERNRRELNDAMMRAASQ